MDDQLGPRGFSVRAGALLRSRANDLKRNDRDAEADLGLEPGTFTEYTTGQRKIDWELIQRAATVWPLNERDLIPVHNDTPAGVRIYRWKDSLASARVIERGGGPYYEYRDTAMSRLSSYRPEWIAMLRVVDDDDPDNPAVAWNQGHLLYQFTYFIGPVNYYYRWGGESYCVPMTTGDSVWGLPFAPHSFTARSRAEPAVILALTYGGDLVGDAQQELAALGAPTARRLALQPGADGALLRSFLAARAMTVPELAARSAIPQRRIAALCAGEERAEAPELASLAQALGLSVRDLLAPRSLTSGGVRMRRAREANRWPYPEPDRPSYQITHLAGDPLHPHTSALEVEVLGSAHPAASLETYQHQYAYMLGGHPVSLHWSHNGGEHTDVLEPGDSAYVVPAARVALAVARGERARVLLLRIQDSVGPEIRFALGAMADGGIDRYASEDRLWY